MVERLRKNPALLAGVGGVVVVLAAIGWWLASPLFINNTVEEAFPLAALATLPAGMTREEAEATMAAAAETNTTADEAMMPDAPTLVKSGMFRDADSFHRGTGDAAIYTLADGSRVLRLESFNVTNGPDLHVYLAVASDPATSGEVRGEGFVDLGQLKGNIGSQNYPIPADVALDEFNSVVIYCQPFHVVFSVAPLNAG